MHEIDQTKLTDQTKFRPYEIKKRSIKYCNIDFILIKKINKAL